MVAIQEFNELDYDFLNGPNVDVDLPFLEAIQGYEEPFSYPTNFFDTLEPMHPKAAFIPKLENSVFEEPLSHTMWTNNFWETSDKSFPA